MSFGPMSIRSTFGGPLAVVNTFLNSATSRWSTKIHKVARTISTWQEPTILAIQTGPSNARCDGYNRVVKHIGRSTFGSHNQKFNAAEYGGLHPEIPANVAQSEAEPPLLTQQSSDVSVRDQLWPRVHESGRRSELALHAVRTTPCDRNR